MVACRDWGRAGDACWATLGDGCGGGNEAFTWKKGYCSVPEAEGRFWGSKRMRSSMSSMASGDACGIMIDK